MKQPLPLITADRIANGLVQTFGAACERLEVLGSVRRRKAHVGDIELLAIPKRHVDLFGAPGDRTKVDDVLDGLVRDRRAARIADGPVLKRFALHTKLDAWPDVQVDLYFAEPAQWGVLKVIRTGNAEFSRLFVTRQSQGGFLPDHAKVRDWRVWYQVDRETAGAERFEDDIWYQTQATVEEEDAFSVIGMPWVEPRHRDAATSYMWRPGRAAEVSQ
jgi:DNA polymerase/3'-5' exonuclease PolX